jgi:hypothetical protein
MAGRRKPDDGYLRETFTLPRDRARTKARDFLNRYPKAAYMSGVESWRDARRRHRIHHAAAAQRGLADRCHGTDRFVLLASLLRGCELFQPSSPGRTRSVRP